MLKIQNVRMSILSAYMAQNCLVMFTAVLPPAVLKLNLQRLLKQGKNGGEEEFIVIYVLYFFGKQEVASFYFFSNLKTGVLNSSSIL